LEALFYEKTGLECIHFLERLLLLVQPMNAKKGRDRKQRNIVAEERGARKQAPYFNFWEKKKSTKKNKKKPENPKTKKKPTTPRPQIKPTKPQTKPQDQRNDKP